MEGSSKTFTDRNCHVPCGSSEKCAWREHQLKTDRPARLPGTALNVVLMLRKFPIRKDTDIAHPVASFVVDSLFWVDQDVSNADVSVDEALPEGVSMRCGVR